MATKLERISRLALDATLSVASSPDHWKAFLDSAAWLYKYPFRDQVLIHAQRPEATACAEIGMWNERLHRWVNKGAKGIALIDTSDEKPHLRYVFDVSHTNSRQNVPLKLWQQTPNMEARISEELENSFGDLGGVSDLTSAVFGTALNAVTDNQKDYLDALLKELGGNELSGTDGVDVTFQLLLGVSVAYTVLKRLGYDADIYLTDDDFEPITQFDTIETISRLGEATSDISEMILRQIERSVRQIEKESRDILANENTIGDNAGEKNSERSKSNGTDLHASRERTDPEPGSRSRTDGIDRQVRTDAEAVSGGKEGRDADSTRAVGQAHAASSGDQRSVQGADRSTDRKDGAGGGHDGTAQSDRSDGMGTADEQYPQPRRGDRNGGADLQLIEDTDEEAVEEAFPASLFESSEQEQQFKRDVRRTKPTTPQMSLFDLQEITPETASTGTLSLRYSQQVIDEALTIGANDKNSRLIICAYFAKDHTPEENAAFLKEHYGTNGAGFYLDGRQYAVWYDAKGFRISAGDTVQGGMTMTFTWEEAAKRIRELLDLGRFLPQEELLRVNVFERSTLAERLIFVARDLSEEGQEQGLLPTFTALSGAFDEERNQIMARMDQPESLQALIDEWRTFTEAHKENPDVLRFRFYRPMRLLHQLEDLQREPIRFSVAEDYSPQPSRFISLDEIDKLLRGSDSNRGTEQRLETYAFFLAHSDSKEREKHLKGIHGEHHGFLAGNDQGEFTSKGIMFSHGDMSKPYAKIEWNWTKVRQRIETLISQNRFLSEKDRDYMLEYERKQIARMIVNVFVDAPDIYEYPFSKNPIGDYWECVAEVQKQLTDPARVNTILDTLTSLEANTLSTDRRYEERHRAVENLTAYRKGEFSLFGEKREDISFPAEDVIPEDELQPDDFEESSVLYRPYAVDDTVYLDGTEFRITNVTSMHVEMIDPTIRYPIFRTESTANFERLLKEDQRNAMFIPPEQQPQEPVQEELPTVELPTAAAEQPKATEPQEEPVKLHSIVIDLRPSWERGFQEPEPQQKQTLLQEAFRDWLWKDPQRRDRLVTMYNERFNSTRPREYDGNHLVFPGMNPEITLRPHQANAIARVLYGGNTLLAHVVGAGKTFEMTAAAMELKRLGLCHKSLFVVPNHLTEQWASEFLQLYPSANILVATKKDFEKQNRRRFCSRIATGDYDAVIIGHSQFEKIPLSLDRQRRTIEEQIEEITFGIEALESENGNYLSIKQLEKTKRGLETKLQRLNDRERKDDVVAFEELGIDRLFVDEAHYYKNLFLYTKMRNVAGISQTEAQKSSDLYMKCRYLDEISDSHGVVFATGTPISNSMTEMYTMQRYLQYNRLKDAHLQHFDAWASTFGETVTAIELAPEGTGYRAKTRFARFFNLPELVSMFKDIADVQTADMLQLSVPEAEYHNEVIKPSDFQREMVASFAERAENVRKGIVKPYEDNMLKITNDGRKLALDQRLNNPMLPDEDTSKVNACLDNIYRIWLESSEQRSAQLVFCDLSTPHNVGKFNVYDDLRMKLIERGVPEEEIAFIHEANTETKKAELFGNVRSGKVRILFGSTAKMGAGTNVQKRLIALHHLDIPWRPSDIEQREGRILRQGNDNPKVEIFRYVTENTFDSYMWQTIEAKQKFIGQIMTSKSPARACEDVDETALTYAEVKALATGNPYIKEKMDLEVQVSKLKLLKSNYLSMRYSLEDRLLKKVPHDIRLTEENIAGCEADMALHAQHKVDGFAGMTVSGTTYGPDEKKDAGVAILAACMAKTSGNESMIGNYMGFDLFLAYDSFTKTIKMRMEGTLSYRIDLGEDVYGNITRMDNALASIPARKQGYERTLSELHDQERNLKEELDKPFPQEDELREKTDRLTELDALLNLDKHESDTIGEEDEDREEDAPERSNDEYER